MGSNRSHAPPPTQQRAQPRTLGDVLRGWDDAAVRALLAERPDLATPTPVDTTQLASRACTRASVSRVLDRVDLFSLTVIEAVAVLSEPATTEQVATLTAAPHDLVDACLRRLRGLAVVWGPDDALRLVRAAHEVIGPHPAGLGPWLTRALVSNEPARVEQLAADLGVTPARDKATTGARIGEQLRDHELLRRLVDDSGDGAEAVLERLTWGPPTGRLDGARRAVTLDGATTPVERLLARGLLVALDERTVVLPREVGLHLRGHRLTREPVHEPPPLEGSVREPRLVDRAAAGAAFEFVRRVEVLLETWGTHPPAVLRGGGVSVRDLRAAANLLGVDTATAALHIETAREAGLLDEADDEAEEVWLPTDAFDLWLTRSFARRWLLLAQTWLETPRAIGLVGRRDDRDRLVNALAPDLERTHVPETRRLVLDSLRTAGPGQGCTAESMVGRLAWLRPRRAGMLRDSLVRWTLDEAGVVGLLGIGALSAHGAALLAADAGVAEVLAPLLPDTVDHVLLQADLTAVAPGPLETDLARSLAMCAEVESRGGATVYRFTDASVRYALDAGWTSTDLHDFLAQRSRTAVPQPLSYLIDDVARRHGQLRVGLAETYLRCDDEALVREVLADAETASLRLRRVAPTVLVTDMPVDLVLTRLREAGRAPAAETADGSVTTIGLAHRRTRSPRRPSPRSHDVPTPRARDLDAAVGAIRAGDRAAESRPDGGPGRLGRTASAAALAALREAAESGVTVWLAYVDRDGGLTERLVDPLRVEGGWLTAYDHRADDARTFAVHRISAVSAIRDR